ncbi:type II secretion system minor pseudopilin GspK [Bordetella tumulicola]|uniref:type II secretion system minor pseudopilin GspK n=1 Tax=Bordetella tumulicola TaxID=1649133 RepID=UPI0039EE321E
MIRRTATTQQGGMAVVSALIVVAIVAALTSGLFLRQTSAIRQIENEQARIQARWLLLGGIDWSRLLLRDNARQEATVRGDQLWATPVLDTRIEGDQSGQEAVFAGDISDEQGKYNLYNLASRGVVDETQVAVLTRLLSMLGLPERLAPQFAGHIAMTQSRRPPGTETAQGAQTDIQGGVRAPQPRGIDDMASLMNVDERARESLRRTMTVLPQPSEVNVNTAQPEVIAALVPGLTLSQARSVTGERDRGRWFNDSGDFSNRLSSYGEDLEIPEVATGSKWFLANGTVAYRRSRVSMQALLSMSDPRTPKTIWIKETP